ncbi:MAG: hypothetical protein JSU92_07515 [Deltaproteobacteria bacterium]|nr:MAG: hypothetical protein JSU92_07515 [Deltaproteobacteria bacterium]
MVTLNILGPGSTTVYVAVNNYGDYIDTSGESHLPLSYVKSARLNIIEDTQSPQVAITYPGSGECFTSSTLVVTGTVNDPEPSYGLDSVMVNGITATIFGSSFSATISLNLGINTLTAIARDNYSNTASDSVTAIMDLNDPSAAITSPATGECIKSTTVVVSGTASDSGGAGVAVVLVNGITATGTYTWSIVFTGQSSPATYQATVIDNCGNMGVSNSINISIDTELPLANITSPLNGECINSTTVVISGTATDAGAGIDRVLVNGLSALLVGDSWSITFTGQSGEPTYEAIAVDNCGNNSVPDTVNITIDPDPPSIAIDFPLSGECIKSTTVVVNGTASDLIGTVEKVWVNGETASGTEFWSVTLTGLTEGPLTITVTAADTCNNSNSQTITVSIDISPPSVGPVIPDTAQVGFFPVIIMGSGFTGATSVKFGDSESTFWLFIVDTEIQAEVPPGVGIVDIKVTDSCGNVGICPNCFTYDNPSVFIASPEDGGCVNTTTFPVNGSFDKFPDSNLVTVLVNGFPADIVITGPQSGTYSITLSGGETTITAFASDGPNTATDTNIIEMDTTPPSVNITQPLEGEKLNQYTVLIKGTADDGNGISSVKVFLDGGPLLDAEYRPATQLWFIEVAVTGDGPHTILATAADNCGIGNESTTPPRSFWVDTNDPTVTINSPIPGEFLNTNTVIVTGSVSDPPLLTSSGIASVKVNGVTAELAGNNFTATLTLGDGARTLWAVVVDNAGNFGASPDVGIFIDTVPPDVEITPLPPLTNQETLIVEGTVYDTGSGIVSVSVFVNGTSFPASLAGSNFSATTILISGPNTIYASAMDLAGNQGISSSWVVTLDNTPPVVIILSPSDGTIFNGADDGDADPSNGFQTAVTVSTDAEEGQTVTLSINGASFYYRPISGGIAFFPAATLPEGPNSLQASVSDLAGNPGVSSTIQVKVDTIPPDISFIYPQSGMIMGPGDDSDNDLTNGLQIDISVSTDAEPGRTVTLIITATGPPTFWYKKVVGGGALFPSVTLSAGTNNHLTAIVSDKAGNIGNTEIEIIVPYLGLSEKNTTIELEWDQSVLLEWLELDGVNIYRSLSPNGRYRKLNEGEILALKQKLTDPDYLEGVRHYYWLSRVDEFGNEYRGEENIIQGRPLWTKNPEFRFLPIEDKMALMMASPAQIVFVFNILPLDEYDSPVTASVISSLPTGVTAAFDPNPVTSFPGTMTLTFETDHTTPPGIYDVTIQASGGPVTNITTVTIPLTLEIIDINTTASAISLLVYPSSLAVTETMQIYGQISPPHAGQTVTITLSSPSAAATLTASSDSDGKYMTQYTPMSRGTWTITSSWPGDGSHLGAYSPTVGVTVGRANTVITLQNDATESTKVGDSLTISGKIDPVPTPGPVTIHMTITNPDGSVEFDGDLTAALDGSFSKSIIVKQAGYIQVEASFEETDNYKYCEAETMIPIQQPIGAAIIIAGGNNDGSALWQATEYLCNQVYQTLINRDFPISRICYFHPDPSSNNADGQGTADDDADDTCVAEFTFSAAGIQQAITVWGLSKVKDYDQPLKAPMIIYMMGSAGVDEFYLHGSITITAASLGSWLDDLDSSIHSEYTPSEIDPLISYPVYLVLESQQAGSFINNCGKSGRVIVAATGHDDFLETDGEINIVEVSYDSFSLYFINEIASNADIATAFSTANEDILILLDSLGATQNQNPKIESDGYNSSSNDADDYTYASSKYFDYRPAGNVLPVIKGIKEPVLLDNTSISGLWAIVEDYENSISSVYANIIPPPDSIESPSTLTLNPAAAGKYQGTYDGFLTNGVYSIIYMAKDTANNAARHRTGQVTVVDTQAPDDVGFVWYEQTLTDPTSYSQIMADSSAIELHWTESASVDVEGYNIYQNGSWTSSVGIGIGSYPVSGLSITSTYTFKVTAYDEVPNESSGRELVVDLDTDGDGLPNLWEYWYYLDPNDATGDNGANGDPDGDGITNMEELLGGLNPQLFALMVGDVNIDGRVDDTDLDLEFQYINGLLTGSPPPPSVAVTEDDIVTIGDVVYIAGFSSGVYPGSELKGPGTPWSLSLISITVSPTNPTAGSTVTITVDVVENISEIYPLSLEGIHVSFEVTERPGVGGRFPGGSGTNEGYAHIPVSDITGTAEVDFVVDSTPGNNGVAAQIQLLDAGGGEITTIWLEITIVGNGTG